MKGSLLQSSGQPRGMENKGRINKEGRGRARLERTGLQAERRAGQDKESRAQNHHTASDAVQVDERGMGSRKGGVDRGHRGT